MCDPATGTITLASSMPYVVSGVGTLLQMQSQRSAEERQQRAIAEAQSVNDQYSDKQRNLALQTAEQYQPEKRQPQYEEAQTKAVESLSKYLTDARDGAAPSVSAEGKLSDDYLTAKANASADNLDRGLKLARLMGNVRGMNDLITTEGLNNAESLNQAATIDSNRRGSLGVAQSTIQNAGRPNAGAALVGGLLSGIGVGMAKNATYAPPLGTGGTISAGGGIYSPVNIPGR